MKTRMWILLLLVLVIFGCPEETEDPNDNVIVFNEPVWFDYNNYVVEPNTEVCTFMDGNYTVGFYIGNDGLIEIRYSNCSPELGAKVIYRVSKMFRERYE